MNTKTVCLQGLLGGLLVTMAVGPLALPAMAQGTILFAQSFEGGNPGGDRCSVPLSKPGTRVQIVKFKDDPYDCRNDEYRYFKFVDVPSATTVYFHSSLNCDSVQWRMGMLTTKNPISTEWKAIQNIRDTAVGGILVPGVKKIDDNGGPDTDKGTLSCIEVYPAQLLPKKR
ncbi:hypothetical protein N5F23_13915 [Pseudomonas sichuanensis]|uniref:hypothetical protein n=1 Tax=Pseudomonas sichuanensis TaxID=2213015 RepID=UPI00244CA508|nr:hypothetical protein [Pseudomonas sichuanensis]MDH0730391.1 hypothetical protein [Pseudomonas sichuanensis]MDH1583678.1 hypothetical protein [Pseudomonas sichuanensis]MDH1594225.1 hypothetical protein [Pseudomonas sichuanensis]MDH1597850.1 hypothetical protein [Pseudomonas sichuanensis]